MRQPRGARLPALAGGPLCHALIRRPAQVVICNRLNGQMSLSTNCERWQHALLNIFVLL
jgi:hypothetical protein